MSPPWRFMMSQPGRARFVGVSRWVSRQISFSCSARAGLTVAAWASAGTKTRAATPFPRTSRRVAVMLYPFGRTWSRVVAAKILTPLIPARQVCMAAADARQATNLRSRLFAAVCPSESGPIISAFQARVDTRLSRRSVIPTIR